MKKLLKYLLATLISGSLVFSTGCATDGAGGGGLDPAIFAIAGAVGGNLLGGALEKNHIISGVTEGQARWIGTALGGLAGYAIGKQIENVKEGYVVEGAALDANIRASETAIADVKTYNNTLAEEVTKLETAIATINRERRSDADKIAAKKALGEDVAKKMALAKKNIERIETEIRDEEAILAKVKADAAGKAELAAKIDELKAAKSALEATEARMAGLYSVHLS